MQDGSQRHGAASRPGGGPSRAARGMNALVKPAEPSSPGTRAGRGGTSGVGEACVVRALRFAGGQNRVVAAGRSVRSASGSPAAVARAMSSRKCIGAEDGRGRAGQSAGPGGPIVELQGSIDMHCTVNPVATVVRLRTRAPGSSA